MKAIIIIVVLFLFSYQTQENKDKELIESFIKGVILTKKKFSFSDTKKYVSYRKKILEINKEKDGFIELLIYEYIKIINKKMNNYDLNYKIISDKEVKKDNKINLTFYKSYSRVYHLVIDNEIFTSFIIEDDKIISFSYNIIKYKSQKRTPFLLYYDHFEK